MVTHNPEIARIAHQTVVLKDGQIVERTVLKKIMEKMF